MVSPVNNKTTVNINGIMWLIGIILVIIGLASAEYSHNQQEFLQDLKNYEIVVPFQVSQSGEHISNKLHPVHSLRRRSADYSLPQKEYDVLHYSVQIENKPHVLRVEPNKHLVAPGLVIERRKNRFKNVTDSNFQWLHEDHKNCHYNGEVVNQTGTRVAIGVCDGLHGFIHSESGEFLIEPIHRASDGNSDEHHHAVYRRSAMPQHLDPFSNVHLNKRSTEEQDSCGVKDTITAESVRDRWEAHHRRRRKTDHKRHKRSVSTERYVETLVVVDPSMIKYHKNEHLETYVLTILNMVATMFHDASIGNSINIVLVRILLLEEQQEELVITHHADRTLQSFCKFQKNINFKDDDHPNHHDVAILLTRKNICSRVDEPCGTLGLAQVSGMCQPHRSCNINEDTGLALAYTVTHELGHNFGMHHDGHNNGCVDPPGRQMFIMASSLIADSLAKSWSNCSMQAITKFIDRDWGYCLNDEPNRHEYKFPVLPPGTMYDADHQCRLQYGNDKAAICSNIQDVCINLWCKYDNKCTTHLEAAAEGTICGTNMWCYEGKCVKIGDRPESINGEWGEWSSWSDCSRSCGAGVSHSQRFCENPQPSHGGRYCLGERKRYRICNTEDCPDDGTTFNEQQCSEFNYLPYKKILYKWDHVPTSETPCQLHCKPKNQFFSVLLKDIVNDGTPCMAGTRNMCISGRCRHVGCDYVIDSKVKEDRCGVCAGDGSTCKTIKSKYTESQGLGYVEATVIPVGARNIRVEEVAAANNFLALQNEDGEYFLNGHWFIQWSGEYKAAGTVVQYTRHGNMESFEAAGPLKEPLHVMLLLQSQNPGLVFEYTVPKDNVTETRVPEFSWQYQGWTHCTASCGGGTQRSEVVCTEIEAGVVDDKYCNATNKPDDKQRVCNEHLCPARWWVGPWQHCSVTCGDNGMHQRTVICIRSLGADEQIALDDEACLGEIKPAEIEPCHKKDACPGNSTWLTGDWSNCNGNHCGLKYRKVWCQNAAIGCEANKAPLSEIQCSEVICGHWSAGDWSECTSSCGNGIQMRKVVCIGSDYCDTVNEPQSHRNCSLLLCELQTQGSVIGLETSTETQGSVIDTATTTNTPTTQKPLETPPLDKVEDKNVTGNIEDSDVGVSVSNASESIDVSQKNAGKDKIETSAGVNDTTNEIGDETLQVGVEDTTKNDSGKAGNTYNSQEDQDLSIENDTQSNLLDNSNATKDVMEEEEDEYEYSLYEDYDDDSDTSSEENDYELGVGYDPKQSGSKSDSSSENSQDYLTTDDEIDEDIDESSESSEEIEDISTDPVEDKDSVTSNNVMHKHIHHHGGNRQNEIAEESVDEEDQQSLDDDYEYDLSIDSDISVVKKGKSTDVYTGQSNKNIPLPSNLPELPDTNRMPPLPKLEDLPPLPDASELPDLPNIEDLTPLSDLSKLPKYPDVTKVDINKLNKARNLDMNGGDDSEDVEDSPPVPGKAGFPNLKKLPNLKDLKDLPKLEDLPPLPDLDKLPKKDPLLALPSNMDLAPLPNFEDLPPLPDIKGLPNKKLLPPLPEEDKNPAIAENTESSEKGAGDSIIQKEISEDTKLNQDLPLLSDISTVLQSGPALEVTHTSDEIIADNVEDSDDELDNGDVGVSVNTDLRGVVKDVGDIVTEETNHVKSIPETDDTSESFVWKTSDWNECSSQCNRGVRIRTVSCIDSQNMTVDQILCDIIVKPTAIEDCNTQDCLPWRTSAWAQCSATCGYGKRLRQVSCPEPGQCDPREEPVNEESCKLSNCVKWVSGQWNWCNKKCGGGEQVRLVQCVNLTSQLPSSGCDYKTKPTESQKCNTQACQNNNQALKIDCSQNEMSSLVCRALQKMGHCSKRFVSLKCCKTCGKDKRRKTNKDRPRSMSLR